MSTYKKSLTIYILLFVFLPLVLFLYYKNFQIDFPSGFGEIFGVLSLSLFSGTVILAWRNKFFDRFFDGLDKLYYVHIVSAKSAFLLALLHPIFLLSKYTTGPSEYIDFLWFPHKIQGSLLGFFSILLLFVIIITSLYFKSKYHIWKMMHKLAGPAFILLYLHAVFIPNSVMKELNLSSLYLHFISLLAIFSYIYQAILRQRILPYKFKLKEAVILNRNTFELIFDRDDFRFKPGQFAFLSLSDKRFVESHPFSFSSGADSQHLRFTIKVLGDYTKELYRVIKNNKLPKNLRGQIEGPYGVFNFKHTKYKKQIWIAGGVGVTPFVSMSEELVKHKKGYDVSMFYSVYHESEAIYKKELQKNINNFYLHETEKNGLLTVKKILDKLKIENREYAEISVMLCAPPAMIKSLKEDFLKYGFKEENIIYEKFDF